MLDVYKTIIPIHERKHTPVHTQARTYTRTHEKDFTFDVVYLPRTQTLLLTCIVVVDVGCWLEVSEAVIPHQIIFEVVPYLNTHRAEKKKL